MAQVSNFECDICATSKGEANRWLLGKQIEIDGVLFIALRPWSNKVEMQSNHFCSDKCALIWQQRAIDALGR